MRKMMVVGLAVASLFVAASAMADEGGSGLQAGLRLGYGLPMGESVKGAKMSDGVSGMIPIWLDVGYRIDPSLYAGLYAQYGIVSAKNDAFDSGSDIRFGVMGAYHISPDASFDPWVGLGVGYEMFKAKGKLMGADFESTTKGLEFLNLQFGGDYKVSPDFGIGPFLSFSLGQYSSATSKQGGQEFSGDISDKAMHQWLTIGVRGAFNM